MPDAASTAATAAGEAKPEARLGNLRTALLLLLTGCVMAGNGLVVPMLTLYGQRFAASATLVGMLITIFGIGRLGMGLPTGIVARRVGSRTLLVAGNGLLLAGALGAAIATEFSVLLAARLVQGIGSGIFLTAAGIVIAETSRPANRGRFMALYQAAIHTGAGIGPTIGGFLAEAIGITAPFWAYAALSLAAMLMGLWFPSRKTPADAAAARGPRLLSLFRSPPLLAVLSLSFAMGFTRTAAHWQMVPLLAADRLHMGFDGIGMALTVAAFANVAVLPLSGWLIDRVGVGKVTPLATLALALSLVAVAFDGGLSGFWIGIALLGFTGGLAGPAIGAALVEAVQPDMIGPAVGAQRTLGDLGFLLGPVLLGALLDFAGFGAAAGLTVIAAVVAAPAMFFWLVWRRIESSSSGGPQN